MSNSDGGTGQNKMLLGLIQKQLTDPHVDQPYIPPKQIARALRANPNVPLSPELHQYLCDILEGKVKPPGGRPRSHNTPARQLVKLMIPGMYKGYHDWLKKRKRSIGLNGWEPIRQADWWSGSPSERAARMVCRRIKLEVDWRWIQNRVSKAKTGRI